ncbi:dienelactone hydrolase family-domain-containing protein [Gorgonomyces haynaldii]|nr:dienelactone hydrolase family-domain-containing protein [Gorgonomyces haynaldii]
MSQVTYKEVPYWVHGSNKAIGIIVIQEWWGVSQHIKNMCQRYSDRLNAVAISPDLYRGKVATKPDEASHLMNQLNWPGAVTDITNAAEYLRSIGCTKIGVVGFCMGGALTIAAGVHSPIDVGVCFYGIPPQQLADPKNIKVPMQFHFGDKDHSKGFADIAAADALREAVPGPIKEYKIANYTEVLDEKRDASQKEFLRYTTADHAFMNEEGPAYPKNLEAAKFGMDASVAFLAKYLQ